MSACGLCEREQPESTAYLCVSCDRATVDRLVALPGMYERLAAHLAPGSASPGLVPSSGRPGSGLPVFEPVLDLRGPGGMVALVESWRAALHDDAGWSPVQAWGSYEDRLRRATRALRLNMPWIVANWPVAGAFAEEIRDLCRDVDSILDPEDAAERGRVLGNCPAISPEGVVCGVVLRHHVGQPVACGWCGSQYGPDTWLNLKSWMDTDAREAS